MMTSKTHCHPERALCAKDYATPGGLHRFFASLRMTVYKIRMLNGTAEAVPFPVFLSADS